MVWDRQRIEEDLRGLLDGEVHCDPASTALYSTDGSIFQIEPTGVVRPRHIADVMACVEYSNHHKIPLHPRGAGSGVSGESLGPGLAIDFSTHFRRIEARDEDTIRVQPGVVLSTLNSWLANRGRVFGPDPATASVATVGGVLGRNSSGSRYVAYGSTRDCTEQIQVVLANGQLVELNRSAQNNSIDTNTRTSELKSRLQHVIDTRADAHPACEAIPEGLRPAYALPPSQSSEPIDLMSLMVGSEGTLGMITEVTLKTSRLPKVRGIAFIPFLRLRDAAISAQSIAEFKISACDLLDRRLLSLAREESAELANWVSPTAEAMLLVEVSGDDHGQVRDELEDLARRGCPKTSLAGPIRITLEPSEVAIGWQLVKHVVPRMFQLKGKTRPLPLMEDVWVPVPQLPELIETAQRLLRKYQVIASVYSHAAHGELHLRPFVDLSDFEQIRQMQSLATEYFDAVFDAGGTISVEQAWGLSRSWYLRERFPKWHALACEIKRVFDPQQLMNPGRLGDPHPTPPTVHLRALSLPVTEDQESPVDMPADRESVLPVLDWNEHELLLAARQCNGCARCRVEEESFRMCPMFHARPREEASPRAKANIVRAVLSGGLTASDFSGDALKEVADLCVHCHQCRMECPAAVDIPKLVAEWKGQYVAANGLRPQESWLARPERFAQIGQRFVSLTNRMLGSPQARWFLERLTGIASGRKLPKVAKTTFLRMAQKMRLTHSERGSQRKVAYFVDVYANWFDTELAQATVAVLRHNGFSVFVPPRQLPAGMPLVASGAIDAARAQARKNVAYLAEIIRQGYTIVTSEPSAALCLTHEYRYLLPDEDEAQLVAEHTCDVGSLLWKEHLQGRLQLDFKPRAMKLVYHLPCHLKALPDHAPGLNLLKLIPGLNIQMAQRGCSGMAGMFGIKRQNYRTSLRIGWDLIDAVRDPTVHGATTECSTCKLQMEQGGDKPTVHPMKILASAYGILRSDTDPLDRHSQPLVVS